MATFRWFVYGKHPSFADFFSIGEHSQITLAYKNWVIRGYDSYLQTRGECRRKCSYRFWSKGGDQELLLIGLLHSSVDSVGRCFPLLFLGSVALPLWQNKWRSLSQQLSGLWIALEEAANGCSYTIPQDILMVLEKVSFPPVSLIPCSQSAPSAFFSGGCGGSNREIFFNRPLNTADFLLLFGG